MSESNLISGAGVQRILAELVPTHDAGERQTSSGQWVSMRDAVAWHEAAHAVVFGAFGVRVLGVSIDPLLSAGVQGIGFCHVADLDGADQATVHRVKAISIMAGPMVTSAVRQGLGVDEYFWGTESLSQKDAEGLDAANAALPEGGPNFEALCQQRVITVILHRLSTDARRTQPWSPRWLQQRRLMRRSLLRVWQVSRPR
jgi:hypothetical protein